jgi:hypothetical protein
MMCTLVVFNARGLGLKFKKGSMVIEADLESL